MRISDWSSDVCSSDLFGVPRAEVEQVMAEAERTAEESVDLYGFTRVLKARLDQDGRLVLMEALWEVVYADGTLHDSEAQLMRRQIGRASCRDRVGQYV